MTTIPEPWATGLLRGLHREADMVPVYESWLSPRRIEMAPPVGQPDVDAREREMLFSMYEAAGISPTEAAGLP